MTDTTLADGKLWSGIIDLPKVGDRAVWAVNGARIPGTVTGYQDVDTYRHIVMRLDFAAPWWNCDQWHDQETDEDLPVVDCAGVEVLLPFPHEMKPLERPRLPPFEMVRACMEARRICGRKWKEAVRSAWYNGRYRDHGLEDYSAPLQRLRNLRGRKDWYALNFPLPIQPQNWHEKRR